MLAVIALLSLPVVAAGSPAPAAPPPLTSEEVSFSNGSVELTGTVLLPQGKSAKQLPGIVLVHGSGSGLRKYYLQEAQAFARAGIVALVYDKRTAGYTLFHRDFPALAEDALAAVRTLQAHPDVDATKVGLWGLSEGGWVAPLAASRSTDVDFLITIGASGHTPLRTQSWNLRNLMRRKGLSGSILDAVCVVAARAAAGSNLFAAADFDPLPALLRIRQPVLAIWGELDRQVPPQESAQILEQTLARAGNAHVTIRFLDDAQHAGRRTSDGFDRLGDHKVDGVQRGDLAPGYADLMTSWVDQVAGGDPPSSSADAPPQQDSQSGKLAADTWYESIGVQNTALALLLIAFAGYPLVALVRRIRGRRGAPLVRRPARLMVVSGLMTTMATVPYASYALATSADHLEPFVAGRPLLWLLLQAFAVITVAATVATALAWRRSSIPASRSERIRLSLLMLGGIVFVPWAIYWRLLVP